MVILFVGLLVFFVYFKAYTLVSLRRGKRLAAVCCDAPLMLTLGGVSLAMMQGSNLAPLMVVASLPVAIAFLFALLVLDVLMRRRGAKSAMSASQIVACRIDCLPPPA